METITEILFPEYYLMNHGDYFEFSVECPADTSEDAITQMFGDNAAVFDSVTATMSKLSEIWDLPTKGGLNWWTFTATCSGVMSIDEFMRLIDHSVCEHWVVVGCGTRVHYIS